MRFANIVLLMSSTILLGAVSPAVGQVREKDTKKFFNLGSREFPVTSENQLSDGSAEEILNMIKREYEGESGNLADVIWRHLQYVYSGPLYDDIMMYAIKIKLDSLFNCLRRRDKDIATRRSFDYGQLVWWEIRVENTHHSKRGLGPLGQNKFYRVWGGNVRFGTWSEGPYWFAEAEYAEIYYANINETVLSDNAEQSQAESELRPKLERAIGRRKEKLRTQAINSLVEQVAELCTYYLRQTDPSADKRGVVWDNLMLKIPEIPLSLADECGEETAEMVSHRLVVKVAEFIFSKEGQEKLITFAKEHQILDELHFPDKSERLF